VDSTEVKKPSVPKKEWTRVKNGESLVKEWVPQRIKQAIIEREKKVENVGYEE
jgi:hypothetical protein